MREHGCPRRPLPPASPRAGGIPETPADARHFGPDAILYVAIASAVMSAAIGAYGAYASSQAQAGALEYNAMLAQQQARTATSRPAQAAYARRWARWKPAMAGEASRGMGAMAEAELRSRSSRREPPRPRATSARTGLHRAYDRTQ